jgi:putative ABC transport system permease protein
VIVNDVLYMALRYLQHNWIKTVVLIASITLILFLPAGLQTVVNQGSEMLTSRAAATPLLIGSKGSAIDLALSALYFRSANIEAIGHGEVSTVNQSELAMAIPLHVRYQASGFPIIGTTLDYFHFRDMSLADGRLFAVIGECMLGANVAEKLGINTGGHLTSTPAGAFDVAGTYPLKMSVVGVLAPSGTPDDDAVFVDLKTTWIIAGLAHGHDDVTKPEAASAVYKREENNIVANASLLSYTEITPENIDSFHFHGDPDEFPVDAIIVVPDDRKSGILLRGRYETEQNTVQILVPLEVIDELLETVFSVRDWIILGSIGVGIATVATIVLVFTLSIRLRKREIETIRKIGGPRRRLTAILGTEILLVFSTAILFATGLTYVVSRFAGALIRYLSG